MRKLAVLLLALSLYGCAARPIHPGTANSFDSSIYDSLLVTHNVIESTKTELSNNSFSPSIAPNVKAALNKLIAIYNDTDTLYCNPPQGAGPTDSCAATSYHALAVAGQSTPALDVQMRAKATDMNSAVTALTAAKGGN